MYERSEAHVRGVIERRLRVASKRSRLTLLALLSELGPKPA
jgi:hypothetical protein